MKLNQTQLRNLQVATERLCLERSKINDTLSLWQTVRAPLFCFNEEQQGPELTGVESFRDVSQLGIISALCLLGETSLVTIDLEGLGMTPAERMLFFGFCNFILDLKETISFGELGLQCAEHLRHMGVRPDPECPTRRHFVCNCRVPHLFLNLNDAFLGLRAGPQGDQLGELTSLIAPCRVSSVRIHFQIEGSNHVLVTAELVRYARALMTLASSAVSQAIALWKIPGTTGFDVEDEDLLRLFEHAEETPFQYGSVLFHCEG